MAIAVVNKKQTGSAQTASLAITAATAGNVLVALVGQTSTAEPPTITGWTSLVDHASGEKTTQTIWAFVKLAEGGETAITPTAAAGGVLQGIAYVELSGASTTVDVTSHSNANASAKTAASTAITTTDAGDFVFAGVFAGALSLGKPEAWTGANVLTNVETAATRVMGATLIPGSILTAQTFTANYELARIAGVLVVTIKPAAGGKKTVEESVVVRTGAAISQAARKVATAASTVVSGSRTSSEAKKVATASTTLVAGARTSTLAQRSAQGSATLTAGARTSSAAQRAVQGSASVSAGASTSSSAKLVATGTATIRAGARLLVTISGQKVFEGTVTMAAGARTASQAVKVATAFATLRAGASTSSTGKRVAQEAATLRAGTRTSSAARMVAIATVRVHAGARIASSARVTFTGVVRMATGARIVISTELPPPPPLKPGPITLGEDLALVTGVDLGPTTGEAR